MFLSTSELNGLSKLWDTDDVANSDIKHLSKEEQEVEDYFVKTTTRDENGVFVVSLPFRDNVSLLGDSRAIALKRFNLLECKLNKNPSLRNKYVEFIDEYQALDHMSEITEQPADQSIAYYLPHHAVIKASSATTPVRVVFDASAATTSGLSLNDTLKVGPVIQSDLFSIVIRFRIHRFVITADIAKMFRQIRVVPEHRVKQRILWRQDPSQEIKTFELNTVTYGTASASYRATRCLYQLALENEIDSPRASSVIKDDFYMDDLISGGTDIDNTAQLANEVMSILRQAGFALRKWRSNSPEILQELQVAVDNSTQLFSESESKVLGLQWDSVADTLTYSLSETEKPKADSRVTKRQILSTLAAIYDPLGLLSPVMITAKILLQALWQLQLGWDEAVPQNVHTHWREFCTNLNPLIKFRIHRHVLCINPITIELHGFSDASEKAFGACLYLISSDAIGNRTSNLLAGRTRVAPLKFVTLPRLELNAAVVLAKLVKQVKSALNLEFRKQYFWSDSTIVLCWIRKQTNELKTYVANRVGQIQAITDKSEWRYIRSGENPADALTRGLTPDSLLEFDLWWHGPSFLLKDPESWCSAKLVQADDSNLPEIRQNKGWSRLTTDQISPQMTLQLRFSSIFPIFTN